MTSWQDNNSDNLNLTRPELYLNRELSLLEFNRRVLAQARDERVPLLERLRFLCISSSNLDEFFEIRVAGLKQKAKLGATETGPDHTTAAEALKAITARAHELVADQYRMLNDLLLPGLESRGVRFIRRTDWNHDQETWLRRYFKESLQPVLSPLGLDPAHPFPRLLNKSLNFMVSLTGKDAFGRNSGLAMISAPRSLPRVIQLPADETGSGPHDFVFLSSVIHAHADDLFHGMTMEGFYQFRVTRNSDLFVDEEEIDDLLRAVEGELLTRHYGDSVRLEVAHTCPPDIIAYLCEQLKVESADVYQVAGPVNLNRLQGIYDLCDRTDLKYPAFTPELPRQLLGKDLFKVIAKGDVLLHHPFQSFLPVIDFVRQSADDPQVLAIKQTLYRTGPESAIVDALVKAAHAGKEVTVVIELRARFDEAANVALATRLQRAGVHVTYGVVGYKTHAKMILVVRREGKRLRHYVHLATGNYHLRTARAYTDYGLFTCRKYIGEDVHRVFNQLTSLGKVPRLNRLLHSPFTLHKGLKQKIARETEFAESGRPARIIIKVNALIEPQLIQALYRAAQSGVEIDLIVRGMCSLRPGIRGVSDNIRVRSIVGRFLEHTRVFYFFNDGAEEIYASSADWMERNMFRRVEVCFPLENPPLRQRVIDDLRAYLKDNSQAWLLSADGSYRLAQPGPGEAPYAVQEALLAEYCEAAGAD